MNNHVAFTRTTTDQLINEGETLLHGLLLLTSVTGGDVTLYEGLDPDSGRKIWTFKGEANISQMISFPAPLWLERGLYIDVGSNVTEVTLFWTPVRNT